MHRVGIKGIVTQIRLHQTLPERKNLHRGAFGVQGLVHHALMLQLRAQFRPMIDGAHILGRQVLARRIVRLRGQPAKVGHEQQPVASRKPHPDELVEHVLAQLGPCAFQVVLFAVKRIGVFHRTDQQVVLGRKMVEDA